MANTQREQINCYQINLKHSRVATDNLIWSLTLREERGLRVFQNWVLRGILGAERDEVAGEWRKLHNEELNYLYYSANTVWVIKSRM